MISPEGLKHLNREAAVAAAERDATPVLLTSEDWESAIDAIDNGEIPEWFRKMPFLGDVDVWAEEYANLHGSEVVEYEEVDSLFHDITGYNVRDAGGPALSIYAYAHRCKELTDEHGPLLFAITDAYQFQAHTAVLRAQ